MKSPIDWAAYAEDVRNLLLATCSAGPTAMRVWTTAWFEWATFAAKTHEQMALGWSDIIREPGRGGDVLNKMREDFKQYLLQVGGIPERAVLEFLEGVSATASPPGPDAGAADGAVGGFVTAADEFVTQATDALNQVATAAESDKRAARGAASSAAAQDPVAQLGKQISRLRDAQTRLSQRVAPPTVR
jgi:hypothetical protein